MAQDKNKKTEEQNEKQSQLEQKIEAMMNPRVEDPVQATPVEPKEATEPPAIDIFRDTKTAPKVSPDLLKEIGVDGVKTSSKPRKVEVKHADNTSPAEETEVKIAVEAEAVQEVSKKDETQESSEVADLDVDSEPYNDQETDKAVDEIAAQDSDKLLDVEDAEQSEEAILPAPKTRRKLNLKGLLKSKKFWLIFVALILVIVFAVPASRYKAVGLVYQPSLTLTVLDSKTNTPVSKASVNIHGSNGETDGNGQLKIKARPGNDSLKVTKKYYKTHDKKQFVSLKQNQKLIIKIDATGRQVIFRVNNSISGDPVQNAELKVFSTTAKTDKKGQATIVVPAKEEKTKLEISAQGFNKNTLDFSVDPSKKTASIFTITPTGKVYFLSNLNGTIDVVKSDLDGKNRQVVVQGTGKEDARSTSLLASRDWQYLILKSKRENSQQALYTINTQTDKLTKFDSGAGKEYQLVGWYNHNFVYNIVRPNAPLYQAGRMVLATYDAERSELKQIDQTASEGNAGAYASQEFSNFYILDNLVTYNVTWISGGMNAGTIDMASKKNSIRAAAPTGQNKKDYQTFSAKDITFITAALYEPQAVYYAAYNDSGKASFYEFEDRKVTAASAITEEDLSKSYPTYLVSPNGGMAFWSDYRDGKNTLLVGRSKDLSDKKQIATLSEFAPYGWFGDNYILVSKNSSELYITTEASLQNSRQPLKITDYYKPDQSFNGYGYGYGGL